jgi:L-lactate dehydrogenase complex protein LldF
VEQRSNTFLDNASAALKDSARAERREMLALFSPLIREASVGTFAEFESTKAYVKKARQHSLDNLAYYLNEFETQATENGSHVHYARDAAELNSLVLDICQQHSAQRVAKGKSMVTEETGLNQALEQAGLSVLETDLGEYIVQQAEETPSHIVGPALHKSADEVRELFLQKHPLGERELETTQDMVFEARRVLREHFLEADVGVIGSNALIAENGYSMLVTNEGNGDLCANLPPVLIICTTIDRVLPLAKHASAMQRLLVRSATGQPQTCYTSFYSGPRRGTEPDGPLECHFVLLDNGRSDIAAGEYSAMLECIRCGTCLTHCPIYNTVGGHAYGWVYQGPMGSVLTPLLTSLEESAALPNACTSCGRCAEVCPSEIPLPDLLRDLRAEENARKISSPHWRLGIRMHAWLTRQPRLYHFLTGIAVNLMRRLSSKTGAIKNIPFAGGFSSQRDFPAPEGSTFMRQYQKSSSREGGGESSTDRETSANRESSKDER